MADQKLAKAMQAGAEALKQIRQARETLTARRDALAGERGRLVSRNEFVRWLPVTPGDAEAFVCECVDLLGRGFLQRASYVRFIERFAYPQVGFDNSMGRTSQRPLALADIESARTKGIEMLGLGARHFFCGMLDTESAQFPADAMCFFFGDAIKAKLKTHLGELFPDYRADSNRRRRPEFHAHYENASGADLASSIAQRIAEIEKNALRIEQLDDEIQDIDESLAALAGGPEG